MTAISTTNPASVSPLNRIARGWRYLFAPGDITSLIATTILLLMPVLALEAGEWPFQVEIIIPVLLISLGSGFLLARSRFGELLSLMISTIYGFCFILIIAGVLQPGNNLASGMTSIVNRFVDWVVAASSGGINQDNVVFTILLAALFWYMGYNAIWHVFRIDRVWRVIMPPGLILVMNVIVYSGNNNVEIYLLIFVLMALVLIIRSTVDVREWNWYINGVRVPKRLRRYFIRVGAVLALLALVIAVAVPMDDIQERLDRFQEFLQSDPLRDMAEMWNRLFEPLTTEGPATSDYYGSDSLNLGGAISLGDQVVMTVAVDDRSHRYYWRSRVFENYENGRWSPSATLRVPDLTAPINIIVDQEVMGNRREAVEQRVTVGASTSRLIYTAPQPLEVDLTGRIDLKYTNESQNPPMNVSVVRPDKVLEQGTTYTVTSMLSTATANELRNAGTNYPGWVVDPNLRTAVSVSDNTAQLAIQIVNEVGAVNPYDRTKAIEQWLRRNITYNESIGGPPPGIDPVDWVLFDAKQGYCTYYASAMIAMLRSLGIPARMAAGFAQGEWDASLNQYVIREREAHTWVEVYFPGYGWIDFEPTAAQAPLNREGDEEFENQEQPPLPIPSPSPTLTPTAIPSPTPDPATNPQSQQEQPTVTVTPSPTPTATPAIIPTSSSQSPPPPPESDTFLSFILPILGVVLLVVFTLLLILLLLLFLYWWWEWRGLRGLSPISRAYARLVRYVGLIGVRPSEDQTPDERKYQIVQRLNVVERPVSAITQLYVDERYGPEMEGDIEQARGADIAKQAWSDTRGKVLKRWLHRFIPFTRD